MKLSGKTILIIAAAPASAKRSRSGFTTAATPSSAVDATRWKACAGRDGMSAMELDVADAQAIEDFARRATAAHPSLDVLVNNAGIMRAETLDERDLADAGATVTTNLLGRSASSTA